MRKRFVWRLSWLHSSKRRYGEFFETTVEAQFGTTAEVWVAKVELLFDNCWPGGHFVASLIILVREYGGIVRKPRVLF